MIEQKKGHMAKVFGFALITTCVLPASTEYLKLDGSNAMTGPLVVNSTATIAGNSFSVGGSTFVVTGGKVGIGTASPDHMLDVNGQNASMRVSANAGSPRIYLAKSGVSYARWSVDGADTYFDYGGSSGNLFFRAGVAGGTEASLDPDGNMYAAGKLGLGTNWVGSGDNEGGSLRVYSNTVSAGSNWSGRGIFGGPSNGVVLGELNGMATIGGHNAGLSAWSTLYTGSDLSVTGNLLASGRVGVGTAWTGSGSNDNPGGALRVYSNTVSAGSNWSGRGIFGGPSNSVVFGELNGMATIGGHNAGLSAWSTLYTGSDLNVAGTLLASSLAGSGNRPVYSTSTGALTNSTSDARLKKRVTSLMPASELKQVLGLRPVSFYWNTSLKRAVNLGKQEEIGLIAQEVSSVVPQVVGENADGYKTIDYAKLVPILIGAIQAQQEHIKALEKRIDTLEEHSSK